MAKIDSLKILAFTNMTASHKWRLTPIAQRLNEQTDHEMAIFDYGKWNGSTVGADIVIIELLTAPKLVEECHKQGAKVIFEADDAFIDTYGRERKNLQHMGEGWRKNAIETIKLVDALTVTNTYLKENFARFTDKPIHILPNYIDTNWYVKQKLIFKRNTDEVRIGWFGSKGHFEDMKMVIPALKRVLEKYPQAKFVYCGFGGMSSDRLVTEVGWGEDVFKEIPRHRREFVTAVPEDLWPMKHMTLDFDIGIAPLIDDPFNHCKSQIKWMEYGALGVPAVCSPTVYGESPFSPTKPTVSHGKDGFIATTEEDWYQYLCQLVENKTLRQKMGEAARKNIFTNWNIDKHWNKWVQVYQSVIDKR